MSKDEKTGRWHLFGAGNKTTEAEKRLLRLEELRRDLFGDKRDLAEYALNTLLSMLWVEAATERLAVACALSDAVPQSGKAEAPAFAARLCSRMEATPADPLAVPSLTSALVSGSTMKGESDSRAWLAQTLAAILTDALNTVKLILRQASRPDEALLYRETDVCEVALRLGMRVKSPALVEPALRLLRLFTPDLARETGPFGRQTPELRALASQFLATLSPDDLYPLWVALGGPEPSARRDLLPVLDYLNDAHTVPYLVKLLERHAQWPDGDLVGWATVRALQRFGDRRALPALRRLAGEADRAFHAPDPTRRAPAPNLELIHAAQRAIEAIEHKRLPKERLFLLRPSQPDPGHLLRPVADTPEASDNAAELLRPEGKQSEPQRRKERKGKTE